MNERIKELAKQAWEYAQTSDRWHAKTRTEMYDEKFAELIVRECANAIANDSRLNDVRSATNGCVRTIKEHFGVEE